MYTHIHITSLQAQGNAIVEELQRQRQSIQHSRQLTLSTNESIATSETLLNKMSKWWRF